jgi:predicted nuclease of restriction endonuclease-like (RecB) superfamily
MRKEIIKIESRNYQHLLQSIAEVITEARKKMVLDIDVSQATAYWHIGRIIVEYEQHGASRAEYGDALIARLSGDMRAHYGRGFSEINLRNMRRFYLEFPSGIQQTVSVKSKKLIQRTASRRFEPQLSWSMYCELLKEDNLEARAFYEIEAKENKWSIRELKRQMNSMLYERLALSRDKKKVMALSKRGLLIEKPEDAIKEPYILEFLGLKEDSSYTEDQLEQAIIDKLQHFLLELGKGFTFVARQKRITIANRHYFIDLVFYNRLLKCFVLIDLKRGELDHADVGQMNFYLNYYKENETTLDENQPIGLILCAKKDEIFAKYVLGSLNNKVFASKYKLALPSEKELDKQLSIEKNK